VQTPAVRQRVVSMLRNVDESLAARVADGLGMDLPAAQPRALEPPVTSEVASSAALSLFNLPGDGSIAGRRIALLVADGADASALRSLHDALAGAGAAPRYLGARLGKVKASNGSAIDIEATLETMPSPMWDALVVDASADALAQVGPAVEFVKEQYRHCKPILLAGATPALLAAAGIDAPDDAGFIDGASAPASRKTIDAFIKAVGRHKHYEREKDPSPV
jgi:catalase